MTDIANVIAREPNERLAYHRKLGARKAEVMAYQRKLGARKAEVMAYQRKLGARKAEVMAVGNTVTVWVCGVDKQRSKMSLPMVKPKARRVT